MPGRSRCARCARPSAIWPHAAPIRSSATAGASVRQSPALPQAWGLPREAPAGYRAVCGGAAPAQPGLARPRAGQRGGRRVFRGGPAGAGGGAGAGGLGEGFRVVVRRVRVGLHGREFRMYKFRSMVRQADRLGPHFTTGGDDPRITPVGRWLRRTSIDELPQLLNVLKGDMSLVGPRPDLPVQRDLYTEAQWLARCSVRPGITGLAQALYRSEATHEQRLAADLRYAREMSLWLDLQIMLWSLRRLGGKAAN